MSTKRFAGLEALQAFLNGCKSIFASITHTHTSSDITDLQDKLDKKANSGHNHSAAAITNGTLNASRLPTISVEKGGTVINPFTEILEYSDIFSHIWQISSGAKPDLLVSCPILTSKSMSCTMPDFLASLSMASNSRTESTL